MPNRSIPDRPIPGREGSSDETRRHPPERASGRDVWDVLTARLQPGLAARRMVGRAAAVVAFTQHSALLLFEFAALLPKLSGALGAPLYDPVWIRAVRESVDLAIALIGFVLLAAWRAPALVIVVFGVAASMAARVLLM